MMREVVVTGSFDDLRSAGPFRFLEEAAKLGEVRVLLWSDETVRSVEGKDPVFPQEERAYVIQAVRFVGDYRMLSARSEQDVLDEVKATRPACWVVEEKDDDAAKRRFCEARGIEYVVIPRRRLGVSAEREPLIVDESPLKTRVVVTGCYDWFHSGHVRFLEEVSALGDLYVIVGHDENVRLLKGEGHPMFPQEERRTVVQAIRYVKQALVSTGHGWMDAEPEIGRIKPHIYAVNEDGDQPVKREFCEKHGIEYRVLKRLPKEGLPRRDSTELRGF